MELTIFAIAGVVSIITFILQLDLISYCSGAIATVGTVIVLLNRVGASLEEALIFSVLTMAIWSVVFSFIYDMFKQKEDIWKTRLK